MKKAVRWLRISYWWGIIADTVMAILMLMPQRFAAFDNLTIAPSADFGYGLLMGAPLMIGWTVLLFWADRKPLARKDILPITLVVVAGYLITDVYGISAGYKTFGAAVPVMVIRLAMSAMFVSSYANARRVENQTT